MKKIRILPQDDTRNGWAAVLPPRQPRPLLSGHQHFDWVVVGAGFAGLMAARRLAQYKPQDTIALLDAGELGQNASGRNAGFAIDLPHLVALIVVICIVIGLQYEGSNAGLAYLFKPDFSQFSLKSVTAAVGQAFFAIGIGMLASMVFGSYLKRKNANVLRDSSVISLAIVCAGIAAGLMIFPIVFAFGLEPSAGVGLTMITLPNVFNHMAGGQLVGVLFYVGFYFAAFTSAIGLCEAIVGVLMDVFGLSRKKALSIVMLFAAAIGSCAIAIPGFLDVIDLVTSNYLLVISGFAITVFAGWVWGVDNMLDAASVNSPFLRAWLSVSVKYVCPVAILIVFLANFF